MIRAYGRHVRTPMFASEARFSPRSVPELEAWYDAKASGSLLATAGGAVAADLGTVGQWKDRSGNARHLTQATAGLRPQRDALQLCGRPGVRFDGSTRMAGTNLPIAQVAVFAVWQSDSTNGTVYELSSGISTLPGLYMSNTTASSLYARNTGGPSAKNTPSATWGKNKGPMLTRHIDAGTHATHTLHSNAVAVTLATASGLASDPGIAPQTVANFFVGSRVDGTERPIWTLCEMAVYSTVPGAVDTARLEAYFRRKWNIPEATGTQTKKIVCVGDSMTVGLPGDAAHAYPTLLGQFAGPVFGSTATNRGVGSYTITLAIANYATQIAPLYDAAKDLNVLCVELGSNDLFLGAVGRTGAAVYADVRSYCLNAQAGGWKIIVGNAIAREATNNATSRQAERITFNQLMRDNWADFADYFIDFGADAAMGAPGSEFDATWYTSPESPAVHPNNRGQLRWANLFFQGVESLVAQQVVSVGPAVLSLSPSTVDRFTGDTAGYTGTTLLTVTGSGFTATSVIRVGGVAQVTTFLGPAQITCALAEAVTNEAGEKVIDVDDPASGLSNSLFFTVTLEADLGLEYRYDLGTSSYVLSGSEITTVYDQGESGDPARDVGQPASSLASNANTRPVLNVADANYNGENTASFDGTTGQEDFLTGIGAGAAIAFTTQFTQPNTHFFVGDTGKATVAQAYDAAAGANRQSIWCDGSGKVALFCGASLASTLAFSVPRAVCAIANGASSQLYVSSQTVTASGNAGTGGLDSITIGAFAGGLANAPANTWGSNAAVGKHARLIIYTTSLVAARRERIMRYLGAKYGITIAP